MGQKGILVSADNSCKIMLRITVRIIPDFEHPEHFEMFQASRSRQFYNSDAFIRPFMRVYISSAMYIKFGTMRSRSVPILGPCQVLVVVGSNNHFR